MDLVGQLIQPIALGLKVARPGGTQRFHPVKATATPLERRIRETVLTEQVFGRGASLRFPQAIDDLLFRNPFLSLRLPRQ